MNKIKSNTIYNEDCLTGLKRIPDNSVDAIVSDPPYEMDTKKGKGTGVLKNTKYLNEIDYMCNGFDMRILDECMRVMKKINIALFCSKNQIPMYIDYFGDKNCDMELLTWSKTNPPPCCKNKYLSDTEYILYFHESKMKCNLITDSYITPRVNSSKKDPLYHPTKKPDMILCDLINAMSSEGDIILDPFMGSGSTAVACVETGRYFVGFELMEEYHKICEKRIAIALEENPEYLLAAREITAANKECDTATDSALDNIADKSINMAYIDISNNYDRFSCEAIEKFICRVMDKPNFYVMTELFQFPIVLNYFAKRNFKYDIITYSNDHSKKYLLFFRKGGVRLYGTYHTKRKFFNDDRNPNEFGQDTIPHELMRRIVVNSSLPGDTVFCSGGWGTTVEVCMRENRHFIAYEPDRDKLLSCCDTIERVRNELDCFSMPEAV